LACYSGPGLPRRQTHSWASTGAEKNLTGPSHWNLVSEKILTQTMEGRNWSSHLDQENWGL
jgi:hypothetical protein